MQCLSILDLTGQTGIVTGAATGIGEVIARRLVTAGAVAAIADVNDVAAKQAAERMAQCAFPVQVDVTDAASVLRAVSDVLSRRGRLNIVVNSAGIAGVAAPVLKQTDEDWQKIIAINMTGPFNLCRAASHARSALRTHRNQDP